MQWSTDNRDDKLVHFQLINAVSFLVQPSDYFNKSTAGQLNILNVSTGKHSVEKQFPIIQEQPHSLYQQTWLEMVQLWSHDRHWGNVICPSRWPEFHDDNRAFVMTAKQITYHCRKSTVVTGTWNMCCILFQDLGVSAMYWHPGTPQSNSEYAVLRDGTIYWVHVSSWVLI